MIKYKVMQILTNSDSKQLTPTDQAGNLKQREHVVKSPRLEQRNLVYKRFRSHTKKKLSHVKMAGPKRSQKKKMNDFLTMRDN